MIFIYIIRYCIYLIVYDENANKILHNINKKYKTFIFYNSINL